MKRNINLYLNDIIEAIELIKNSTKNLTIKEFEENRDIQDATIRRIEIIGEAVKHLPIIIRKKYPDIRWEQIAGSRDFLVHSYFGVDLDKIWKVIKEDLLTLEKEIKKIMNEIK